MELLLWRWSTSAQVTSAPLIAVFFVVLGRSMRRAELWPWVQPWIANGFHASLGASGLIAHVTGRVRRL